jgi:hypothetical protein
MRMLWVQPIIMRVRLLRIELSNTAQFATVTPVIVDGGHMLPLKKGDIVEYRCLSTGSICLGMILVCNQAMMFYISVYDIEKGRVVWIRSTNILRLRTT